jgi:hypothetical protein
MDEDVAEKKNKECLRRPKGLSPFGNPTWGDGAVLWQVMMELLPDAF